jgi:hypothetical protein
VGHEFCPKAFDQMAYKPFGVFLVHEKSVSIIRVQSTTVLTC